LCGAVVSHMLTAKVSHAGEGWGPGTPMPDFLINQKVTMP